MFVVGNAQMACVVLVLVVVKVGGVKLEVGLYKAEDILITAKTFGEHSI